MNENGQDVLTTFYLHKVLVDTTVITSSSLETAPRVPPAPPGYEDPGGDPDTIPPDEEVPPDSPDAGLDHIVSIGKQVISAGNLVFGDFVEFETPNYYSDDITDISTVWVSTRDDKINLIYPGWYEVNISALVYVGSVAMSGSTLGFNLELWGHAEDGTATILYQTIDYRRGSHDANDKDVLAGSTIFPRELGPGNTISYIRVKLNNLFPVAGSFFVNGRYVTVGLTVKRIRRPTTATV
jgi:hypothetical protein